jgi:uncharacterized iron-regulated protein
MLPLGLVIVKEIQTYENIARAMYQDALAKAQALQSAIDRLIEQPGEQTLASARQAWLDGWEGAPRPSGYRGRPGGDFAGSCPAGR